MAWGGPSLRASGHQGRRWVSLRLARETKLAYSQAMLAARGRLEVLTQLNVAGANDLRAAIVEAENERAVGFDALEPTGDGLLAAGMDA